MVVLGVVASVVVVGGTGPAAGQKSGEGASLPTCFLSSHKGFKESQLSVIHRSHGKSNNNVHLLTISTHPIP